jgi:hypothetical protein
MNLWNYQSCYKHCKPNQIKDTIITVMCAYCHRDELPPICHGQTNSGEPCQRELSGSQLSNFCNWHMDDIRNKRYELSMQNAWKMAKEQVSAQMMMSQVALRDILQTKIEEKVYFIRDGRYGKYVKIGTSKKPYERLESLSRKADTTLRPEDVDRESLYVAWLVSGGREVESWFHSQFYENRVIGEWFNWTDKMIEVITDYENNYKDSFN